MEIDCGTICFSGKRYGTGSKLEQFVSNTIKKATNSLFTHFSFVYPNDNEIHCIEATTPVVQTGLLNTLIPVDRNYRLILKLKDWTISDFSDVINWLKIKFLGREYGKLQLFGAFLSRIFGLKSFIKKGIVCSELGWHGFQKSYIFNGLFQDCDKDLISPQDLFDRIKVLFYTERIEILEDIDELQNDLFSLI